MIPNLFLKQVDIDMYDGEFPGAPSRSLFMLIESIFVVHLPKDGRDEAT